MSGQRTEYKRRRNAAIRALRQAGLSEQEIQDELAKIRQELGISGDEAKARDSVANLPAVVARERDRQAGEGAKTSGPKYPSAQRYTQWSEDWWLQQKPETQARRCKAHRKNGDRCKRLAFKGTTVCGHHGANARHVRNAAQNRLAMAADRMAANLLGLATDADNEVIRLRATDSALDRAGISKPTQVEVGPLTPFETVFDDISCVRPDSDTFVASGQNEQIDYGGSDYEPHRPGGESVSGRSSRAHSDYDRPRGPQAREQAPPDRSYRDGYHVTGDDAVRAANAVNAEIGALRALPPGRSAR